MCFLLLSQNKCPKQQTFCHEKKRQVYRCSVTKNGKYATTGVRVHDNWRHYYCNLFTESLHLTACSLEQNRIQGKISLWILSWVIAVILKWRALHVQLSVVVTVVYDTFAEILPARHSRSYTLCKECCGRRFAAKWDEFRVNAKHQALDNWWLQVSCQTNISLDSLFWLRVWHAHPKEVYDFLSWKRCMDIDC